MSPAYSKEHGRDRDKTRISKFIGDFIFYHITRNLSHHSSTMLALVLSAQALLVPLVSQQPVVVVQSIVQHRSLLATQQGNVFPASTTLLAVGRANLPNGEYYKGESKDLDLGSFLDSVPVDLGGKSGVEKDMAGVARVKAPLPTESGWRPAVFPSRFCDLCCPLD